MNDTISNIVAALEKFDGVYKRDEVDAALALQDEITPHLIGILEEVLADPEAYVDKPDYFGHIYAIELLGHFREPRAHDVIVDLASLLLELPHDLFGDIVTEDLAAILFATSGGSVARIKELLLNRESDVYCRNSAAKALTYAVVEGVVPRQEIMDLFGSLFTGDEADPDSDFWAFLATNINALYPKELMDVIKRAYENDLISEGITDYAFSEETLTRGKAQVLQRLKDDLKKHMPDDIHDSMSWWACFNQEPEVAPPPASAVKKRSKPQKKERPKSRPPRKKKKRQTR